MPVAVLPRSGVSPHSPQPPPPQRQYSFTDFQTNNPSGPLPGDRVDGEYDRTNQAIADVIDWAAVSLNSDGSLKPQSVGRDQLIPGLFDNLAAGPLAQAQTLLDEVKLAAAPVLSAALEADASAFAAAQQNGLARAAAEEAGVSAQDAAGSATAAAESAAKADARAIDADNAAKDTAGDVAICQDYGLVTQAWAEHMPDTIPPNILAVMNVTGDHWSSRWWANHASQVISDWEDTINDAGQGWLDQINDAGSSYLEEFYSLYLGAFYLPPTHDALGNPVSTGALYYDLNFHAPYVWNGTAWVPFLTPGPPDVSRYIYVASAGQTVFTGADRDGNTLTFDPANLQRVQVFRQKLLLTPVNDYTEGANRVTLVTGATAGDIVQIFVTTVPQAVLNWQTVRVDTSGWSATGGVIRNIANGAAVVPASASDVFVSVNGVWQQGSVDYTVSSSTLTFTPAIEADARVFAIAIAPTTVSQMPTAAVTKLDTSSWVFTGSAVTFPLINLASGQPVTPATAANILVSLNGVWQNAVVDYTVTGTSITFTTAPEADAQVFAISGLPSMS